MSIKIPLNAHDTCFAFGTDIAIHWTSYVSPFNGCCSFDDKIFGGPFNMTNASVLISGNPVLCALQ